MTCHVIDFALMSQSHHKSFAAAMSVLLLFYPSTCLHRLFVCHLSTHSLTVKPRWNISLICSAQPFSRIFKWTTLKTTSNTSLHPSNRSSDWPVWVIGFWVWELMKHKIQVLVYNARKGFIILHSYHSNSGAISNQVNSKSTACYKLETNLTKLHRFIQISLVCCCFSLTLPPPSASQSVYGLDFIVQLQCLSEYCSCFQFASWTVCVYLHQIASVSTVR